MVRYASRAPSIDHQWATYVKSTSSVFKRSCKVLLSNSKHTPVTHDYMFCRLFSLYTLSAKHFWRSWNTSYLHKSSQRARSPHSVPDRCLWDARVCWSHLACSRYLHQTCRPGMSGDRQLQSIIKDSMVAGFISGGPNRVSDAIQEWMNHRTARTHKREPIHLYSPVNMLQMSTDIAAKSQLHYREGRWIMSVKQLHYSNTVTAITSQLAFIA